MQFDNLFSGDMVNVANNIFITSNGLGDTRYLNYF